MTARCSRGHSNRLYRSRDGKFLGLCDGIAKWRDLPVFYVRLGVVIAAFFTGFFPALIVYVVASLILDTEPSGSRANNENSEKDFDRRYRRNKESVVDDIKHEYRDLKRRMSRMESDVVDREEDWEERFRRETN